MPRLILLNGPPGIGKSTLARRYVEEHPFALCLDLDVLRRLLGGWQQDRAAAGLLARRLALAAAREHLHGGRDVVVPQYVARAEFIAQLDSVAAETGAGFVEILLTDSKPNALARFHARAGDPQLADQHAEAIAGLQKPEDLERMYDRLAGILAVRAATVVVPTRAGAVDAAYVALLARLP